MENYRELTEKQKRFLRENGSDSKDFLSVSIAYDHYTFYHIETGKEVSLRRWLNMIDSEEWDIIQSFMIGKGYYGTKKK